MIQDKPIPFFRWRFYCIIFFLLLIVVLLSLRVGYLTIFNRAFLLKQGNSRILRTMAVPAYRGMIMDRRGEPLAVSTPVDSVWINPQDFPDTSENAAALGKLLRISSHEINQLVSNNSDREFVYVKRNVNPDISKEVSQLSIPGVYLQRAYRRFYPEGEVISHVIGFTNVDDKGQEGLELVYNDWLQGAPGVQRVLKDLYGNVVAVLDTVHDSKSGHDLVLSIDERLQFLAYQVLKSTVAKYRAASGSVVILDPKTGEILAMVNQPSYNPNRRQDQDFGQFRNRAVTDMFEPGSTMKAFSVANALESGKYTPHTLINTNPGWLLLGHNRVYDDKHRNNGVLTVTQVLQKSSNIGVAKMMISLPPEHFINLLRRIGFGERTASAFPGESAGALPMPDRWRPFVLATLGFGYGISVTPLQLAQAYAVIANRGMKCPVTFLKRSESPVCRRAMEQKNADEMRKLLETVVQAGGTGVYANVPGYRVAGKTGTAYVAEHGQYNHNRYYSSFVGMAPIDDPRLIVAVVLKDPKGYYYASLVAAPAFSQVMSGALRILGIPPTEPIVEHHYKLEE